jgi:ATP-dependent 26S proteasome regulatory subunit
MDIAALKLPTAVEDLVAELVTEDTAASALEERGLDPRRRVLLHGPPGNGKTSLARALGGALGIPALALSSDIVSSHMGETSARLTALADAFGEARFMLVIDEIDSLGVSRGSETTDCSREDARTLTALLMLLDRKLSNWIVATTNRLDRVDVALIRRFDEIIEMPAPSAEQLTELAESLASQYQVRTPDVSRCANFDAVTKTVRTSARRQIVREHVGRAEQ